MASHSRLAGSGKALQQRARSGGALQALAPLADQQQAEAVDVRRQYRQRHGAGKALRTVRAHPIQAAVLEVVDRRFHRRMPAAHLRKLRCRLALPVGPAQTALLRQCGAVQQRVQPAPVVRAVEAPVEARRPQLREVPLCGLDHRHRVVHVGALPHHLVVQHEPELILENAYRNAQLDRRAGLAFGNPAGMRLEEREHLLPVRNPLALEQAALHQVQVLLRLLQEVPDPGRQARVRVLAGQPGQRLPGAVRELPAQRQVRPDPFRRRPPPVAHGVEQVPHATRVVGGLPPARQAMRLRHPGRLPDQAPHRVPQQTDVRRVVHVGFHHERVHAPLQRRTRLLSGHPVAALRHQTTDLAQQLRTQQLHVVHHGLEVVLLLARNARMPQEPAQRPVLVHQLVNPVVVAAETLLDHAHHQNPPHLHARTPRPPVAVRRNVPLQQPEQAGPQIPVAVQVLQPRQQSRNVVAGLRIQLDVLNPNLADFHLGILHLPHLTASQMVEDSRRSATITEFSPVFGQNHPKIAGSRKSSVHGDRIIAQDISDLYSNFGFSGRH